MKIKRLMIKYAMKSSANHRFLSYAGNLQWETAQHVNISQDKLDKVYMINRTVILTSHQDCLQW